MEQITCCQSDVQSIMRRLRGAQTPYTPPKLQLPPSPIASSEDVEGQTLRMKLKETSQELMTIKEVLAASEASQHDLQRTVEQLQAAMAAKERDLQSANDHVQQATIAIERLERDCADLRTRHTAPAPDLALLREELLSLRAEQLSWQEERKRLEAALEQEHHRVRSDSSNANGQLVRLAMNCKQLEEEVHSLTCERAATLRQFNQLKEMNEQSEKALAAEREKRREREDALAASTTTIQELIDTIEKNKAVIATLKTEKEAAAQEESALRSQITIANANLAQEKATGESLSTSLKAANESFQALTAQLEQERRIFHETEEQCALLKKEREAADIRVKEVEELLIVKLQMISDLEEQLGEALTRCEDNEHRALTAEQHGECLSSDLEKMTKERDELHEKALQQEQQIARLGAENAELKKKMETFDRLKKRITDASSYAHALLRTLDLGPKPALAIPRAADDMLLPPQGQERSLFEERFEQHELF